MFPLTLASSLSPPLFPLSSSLPSLRSLLLSLSSPSLPPLFLLSSPQASSPMINVTFDGVVVNNPSTKKTKWGTNYLCEGVKSGVATGTTSPVPPCFKDRTDKALAAEAAAAKAAAAQQ